MRANGHLMKRNDNKLFKHYLRFPFAVSPFLCFLLSHFPRSEQPFLYTLLLINRHYKADNERQVGVVGAVGHLPEWKLKLRALWQETGKSFIQQFFKELND